MAVIATCINISTKGNSDVIDITDMVAAKVRKCGVADGIAALFVQGSTGGFTTIVCQPNTHPVLDSPDVLRGLMRVIAENAVVHVVPAVALSLGLRGSRLSPVAELVHLGAGALSDDGRGTKDIRLLGRALWSIRFMSFHH